MCLVHSQCPITVNYSYCFGFVLCKYKSIGVHIDTSMNKRQRTHREQFSASLMEMSGACLFRDLRREKGEGYFSKMIGANNLIFMGLSLFVCVFEEGFSSTRNQEWS